MSTFLSRHSLVVIDGFPRNVEQIKLFEEQVCFTVYTVNIDID
jgi:adenylate kinase family enzyme